MSRVRRRGGDGEVRKAEQVPAQVIVCRGRKDRRRGQEEWKRFS